MSELQSSVEITNAVKSEIWDQAGNIFSEYNPV